jgi:hypothetical protein
MPQETVRLRGAIPALHPARYTASAPEMISISSFVIIA